MITWDRKGRVLVVGVVDVTSQPPWNQGRAARYIWHSPSGVPLDLLGFKVYQINKPCEILVYNNVRSDIGEIRNSRVPIWRVLFQDL